MLLSRILLTPMEYQLFTSDYAFYWYDYEAGYNTVFDEFGYRNGWANDSQATEYGSLQRSGDPSEQEPGAS